MLEGGCRFKVSMMGRTRSIGGHGVTDQGMLDLWEFGVVLSAVLCPYPLPQTHLHSVSNPLHTRGKVSNPLKCISRNLMAGRLCRELKGRVGRGYFLELLAPASSIPNLRVHICT